MSIGEWAQLEIDRVTEETNRKILGIAVNAHEKLMKQIIRKQEIMMEELPEEAAQLWIELHTAPRAAPRNSSDSEWTIKDSITRKRTDEELEKILQDLTRLVQSGMIDEQQKLSELTKKASEEIELEEIVPMSSAAFRMALIIGVRGGKLKYQLQTISKQAAETQKQNERDARNEDACAAMNANPAQGEQAINTIIQANVRQEVKNQLRRQGNGSAVDQQNQQSTATPQRFNTHENKNKQNLDRRDYFRCSNKAKKQKKTGK